MHKGFKEPGGLMWRVEPMLAVIKGQYGISLSPSGYYAYKKRTPSARSLRDKKLKEKILGIYEENRSCYGVRKIWHALLNEGADVGREHVARLMREMGLKGARRLKAVRTTIAGKNAKSAEDLIRRNFYADAPNRVWVADFTYVSTWEGWCYVAFVIDVFARMIVGYDVSVRMNEAMVKRAFNMAVWNRVHEGNSDLAGLIHHNDKGSQYTANGFVGLLALHGIRASIGSVGDSYDNALAESINGAYKAELIWKDGPWRSYEELNKQTAEWVYWYNNCRISEYNSYRSPSYIEEKWYSEKVDLRKKRKVS
jgi:putative transposase